MPAITNLHPFSRFKRPGAFAASIAALLLCSAPARAAEDARYSSEYALAQISADLASRGFSEENQFMVLRHWSDPLGQTHTHVRQTYKGVPVWSGEAIIHLDGNGKARRFVPRQLFPGITIDVVPSLQPTAALSIAHTALQPNGPYATEPAATLVVLPLTERVRRAGREQIPWKALSATDLETRVKGYVLAYHVHLELENGTEETSYTDFMVDAHSGVIIDQWSTLQTADPDTVPGCGHSDAIGVVREGAAVGSGVSQYSGTVALSTTWTCTEGDTDSGTSYLLKDRTRGTGTGNRTYNMDRRGRTTSSGISADIRLGGSLYVDRQERLLPDEPNLWGDGFNLSPSATTTSANGQTAAVDAHFGLQVSWDMLLRVFGRNGLNGAGRPVYNRVHYGAAYDNAFWSSSCFCMTYGDGSFLRNLVAPDVVGHELAHGLNDNSAGLMYREEAGGLNESNSDIFATLTEFYLRGGAYERASDTIPSTGGNWRIGEQLSSGFPARPLRWMDRPADDGHSPNAWTADIIERTPSTQFPEGGDPHYVSGPLNRWFYFLVNGASATEATRTFSPYLPAGMSGIGIQKAGQIWYRALVTYLTSASPYTDAAYGALEAATDLYGAGSAERNAVCEAFVAINVGRLEDCTTAH